MHVIYNKIIRAYMYACKTGTTIFHVMCIDICKREKTLVTEKISQSTKCGNEMLGLQLVVVEQTLKITSGV